MQFLNLPFVDFCGLLAAALEHAGRAFQQRTLPTVDHRRVHTKLARQSRHRAFALQNRKRDFALKLGEWFFRFDIADLLLVEDQLTTNRSLQWCPNFAGRSGACATAHHWARTLIAMGHEVRIMPPSYVTGYVKRGKSDALDAEAICEAIDRPTIRFVPVKTVQQQSILMARRTLSLPVRRLTTLRASRLYEPQSCSLLEIPSIQVFSTAL